MELAFDGALFLCSTIYENAVSASSNLTLCKDLALHVKGIESILLGIRDDVISSGSYPQSLILQLEYLQGALNQANDVIERYGKRGRILRYILATKVKSEFEDAFQQINQALQPLGAINIQINSECRKNICELSGRVLRMSYSITQEMEAINNKFDELIKQQKSLESPDENLNSKVLKILTEIPGNHTKSEQICDIEDLVEMRIAYAEKKSEEVFMIDQIISVLQEQTRQPWFNDNIPPEIICPITQQVMTDPVIVMQSGQTYERSAIEHWFQRKNYHDPSTKIEITEEPKLIKNYAIKGVIENYAKYNSTKYENSVDLEGGNHSSDGVPKHWPQWLWVLIILVIICVMTAAIAVITFAGNADFTGSPSDSPSNNQEGGDTETELPVCSQSANPLDCDKDVLRRIHNRYKVPCIDDEFKTDIDCTDGRVEKMWRAFEFIPPELSRLDGLQVLTIINSTNYKGQRLPKEWSTLTHMVFFTVKGTNISGALPPEYSTWTNLQKLAAGGNFLKGQIPQQYSTWTNVQKIGFRDNNLQGTIPPQFSTWQKVQKVFLYDNFLTGTLPPQISVWEATSDVRVHRNRFSGVVPPQYSTLKGTLFVQNTEAVNSTLCVAQKSPLIPKFNSENETGDLDLVAQC
eukprot:TRINITY_DN6089_c0_g1_i10.p1 TRINITY_DN6089_c0_g1~~TRINITY_DN6089_c0_g1_i10.p1  ORF type:complete len:635 (-),score=67.91 TRINITY_DN6089_c0_g1_i10:533-2437(-)